MDQVNYQISRVNLVDQVYDRLAHMIATHDIKPGDRINFSEMENLFNVSRAPLREAVQRLVSRGLIVSSAQKG